MSVGGLMSADQGIAEARFLISARWFLVGLAGAVAAASAAMWGVAEYTAERTDTTARSITAQHSELIETLHGARRDSEAAQRELARIDAQVMRVVVESRVWRAEVAVARLEDEVQRGLDVFAERVRRQESNEVLLFARGRSSGTRVIRVVFRESGGVESIGPEPDSVPLAVSILKSVRVRLDRALKLREAAQTALDECYEVESADGPTTVNERFPGLSRRRESILRRLDIAVRSAQRDRDLVVSWTEQILPGGD